MMSGHRFIVALACTVFVAISQGCELHEEIYKFSEKLVMEFVPKHDPTVDCAEVLGCVKAMVTGDSSKCNAKKFKLPLFPTCEKVAQDPEVKDKFAQYNIKGCTPMIENVLFSCGEDADELCERMPEMTEQAMVLIKSYLEGGPDAAAGAADKFCEKDKDMCERMKGLPAKIAAKFNVSFEDMIKNLKNIARGKGMALGGSFGKGITTLFGGGPFGDAVSKCCVEVITFVGKKVAL